VTQIPAANDSGISSLSKREDSREALVTVVIPAYNAAATIGSTLASVTAQTHGNLEIIVVDDGSSDQTAALVIRLAKRDPRIRLLQKENAGLAAARNTGIEQANGGFIAPVDADDIWHPTKIEKQLAVMQSGGRHVGAVYCWARAIDQAGRILFDLKTSDFRGEVFAPLIFWNFIQSGSLLFRRSLAVAIGGYDTTLSRRGAPMCEDFKFNLDLSERCDFDLVPEFLTGYTLRQGSMSTDTNAMLRSHALVVDETRARHPELPAYLFRWASARSERECSRIYLDGGPLLLGMKLTISAALKDPMGAFGRDARRILLGGLLRRFGLMDTVRAFHEALTDARDQGSPPHNFFMADPAKSYRASTGLVPRRLHHVGSLRAARQLLIG
jgi:glycosyltransferase involved in cell wall biosynthesis